MTRCPEVKKDIILIKSYIKSTFAVVGALLLHTSISYAIKNKAKTDCRKRNNPAGALKGILGTCSKRTVTVSFLM